MAMYKKTENVPLPSSLGAIVMNEGSGISLSGCCDLVIFSSLILFLSGLRVLLRRNSNKTKASFKL